MDVLRPLWLTPVILVTAHAPAQQQIPASLAQKVTLHIASSAGRRCAERVWAPDRAHDHDPVSRGSRRDIAQARRRVHTLRRVGPTAAHTGFALRVPGRQTVAVLGPRADTKATARRSVHWFRRQFRALAKTQVEHPTVSRVLCLGSTWRFSTQSNRRRIIGAACQYDDASCMPYHSRAILDLGGFTHAVQSVR